MIAHKKTSRGVGVLFLTAMTASLLGGGFVESIISEPDYLQAVSELLTFNLEVSMGIGLIFVLPIVSNEVFLGIWLIVKGSNPSAISSEAVDTNQQRVYLENFS